jgi:hypothetical protein
MPFSEFIIVIQIELFAISIGIVIFLASCFLLRVLLSEPPHLHRYVWKLLEERHFLLQFDDVNVATIRWKHLQAA